MRSGRMPKKITERGAAGKTCTKCRAHKPYSDFSVHSGASDGRQSHCKQCVARAHREKNIGRPCQRCKEPLSERAAPWAKFCDICRRMCTECGVAPRKRWSRRCSECSKQFDAAWYASNPQRLAAIRVRRVSKRYGVSLGEAERLTSVKSCEACGKELTLQGYQHIDHCHITGAV